MFNGRRPYDTADGETDEQLDVLRVIDEEKETRGRSCPAKSDIASGVTCHHAGVLQLSSPISPFAPAVALEWSAIADEQTKT